MKGEVEERTSCSSSSRLKMSDFWVCDQPRRAAKFTRVAAKTPWVSLKKLRSISALRLLSFCPDLSTSRGTWPNCGGVHLKAL